MQLKKLRFKTRIVGSRIVSFYHTVILSKSSVRVMSNPVNVSLKVKVGGGLELEVCACSILSLAVKRYRCIGWLITSVV